METAMSRESRGGILKIAGYSDTQYLTSAEAAGERTVRHILTMQLQVSNVTFVNTAGAEACGTPEA